MPILQTENLHVLGNYGLFKIALRQLINLLQKLHPILVMKPVPNNSGEKLPPLSDKSLLLSNSTRVATEIPAKWDTL
ncbi:hypothetical protein NIES2111_66970 (plasmid) [Nostoc sp. NIES-2111]|nr:hypothetical protein NIES2111_66970 [Nostoc sp. NIES-2111]